MTKSFGSSGADGQQLSITTSHWVESEYMHIYINLKPENFATLGFWSPENDANYW